MEEKMKRQETVLREEEEEEEGSLEARKEEESHQGFRFGRNEDTVRKQNRRRNTFSEDS